MSERRRLFAKTIATQRRVCHFSRQRLANIIGVSRDAIEAWEQGLEVPRMLEAIALAYALGFDPWNVPDYIRVIIEAH